MPRKKDNTKYRKTVSFGRDHNGKLIRKDFYAPTKKELDAKIEAYRRQSAEYVPLANEMGFSKWAELWLDTYKDGRVESGTANVIHSRIARACDYFGDAPLVNIHQADIMRFFKKHAHYSTGYLRLMFADLNQIFNKAQANHLIATNPMSGLEKPVGQKTKTEKKSYTYDEYRTVLDFAKGHILGLAPFIMLKTGVRVSELLGLKGSDIDFEKHLVHIRRASTRHDGIKTRGKTAGALRSIPIDNECYDYLWKRVECHSDQYLFPHGSAAMLPHHFDYHIWRPFQKDLLSTHPELPEMSPHEYRHTYGTLLYQAGTELLTLSRVMGHSSVRVTQKTYVHDTVDDAIERIRFPTAPVDNSVDKADKSTN